MRFFQSIGVSLAQGITERVKPGLYALSVYHNTRTTNASLAIQAKVVCANTGVDIYAQFTPGSGERDIAILPLDGDVILSAFNSAGADMTAATLRKVGEL